MKVVIDTNILVSALLNPHGVPAEVLGMVLEDKITPCYDVRIIFEYNEVLQRNKFNFSEGETNAIIDFIKNNGQLTIVNKYLHKLKDPDDLPFLEVALGSQAEFLITGNTAHFPAQFGATKTVSPAQFITKYFNS